MERPAAAGLGDDWDQRREAQMGERRGDRDSGLWVPDSDGGGPATGLEGKAERESEKESESHHEAKSHNAFVFSIAAAGWHTGALVLGDPKSKSQSQSSEQVASDEQSSDVAGSTAPSRPTQPSTNTNESRDQTGGAQMPGAFPFGSGGGGGGSLAGPIFRVGFAGRGSTIGSLAQRNWQARAGRGRDTNPQQHAVEGEAPREARGANEGDDGIERGGGRAETDQDVVSRWQQPGFE